MPVGAQDSSTPRSNKACGSRPTSTKRSSSRRRIRIDGRRRSLRWASIPCSWSAPSSLKLRREAPELGLRLWRRRRVFTGGRLLAGHVLIVATAGPTQAAPQARVRDAERSARVLQAPALAHGRLNVSALELRARIAE